MSVSSLGFRDQVPAPVPKYLEMTHSPVSTSEVFPLSVSSRSHCRTGTVNWCTRATLVVILVLIFILY